MDDLDWLEPYRELSSGTLGHLGSDGFLDWRIQPLFRPVRMLGVALTVSCPPSDNTALGDAARSAEPGTVLVVARAGDRRHAAWGGLMSRAAQHRGLSGVVIDGAATDWREVVALQFPVFCTNLSALTTRRRELPGSVGDPVVCGGVTVHSGDIVLGDDDGVVVLPRDGAEAALASAARFERWEWHMRAALDAGLQGPEAREAAQRALDAEG